MLRVCVMARTGVFWTSIAICMLLLPLESKGYDHLDSFTDSLLSEVMSRMSNNRELSNTFDLSSLGEEDYLLPQEETVQQPEFAKSRARVAKEYSRNLYIPRHDDILDREPSIRDQEYLEHSSLFGHQYVQGGAGEGSQRLGPDGNMNNMKVVKTDGVLPAYCNPPNPCPLGYSGEDSCLEIFENTAEFSSEYQASQECMCDTEHMFNCPGTTQDNEIDALARSIQNEGIMDSTLDQIVKHMQIDGEHKNLVAKKFFSGKSMNPYLEGEKLPVVAKKTPRG